MPPDCQTRRESIRRLIQASFFDSVQVPSHTCRLYLKVVDEGNQKRDGCPPLKSSDAIDCPPPSTALVTLQSGKERLFLAEWQLITATEVEDMSDMKWRGPSQSAARNWEPMCTVPTDAAPFNRSPESDMVLAKVISKQEAHPVRRLSPSFVCSPL